MRTQKPHRFKHWVIRRLDNGVNEEAEAVLSPNYQHGCQKEGKLSQIMSCQVRLFLQTPLTGEASSESQCFYVRHGILMPAVICMPPR